jgi:hypothetical protein
MKKLKVWWERFKQRFREGYQQGFEGTTNKLNEIRSNYHKGMKKLFSKKEKKVKK